MTKNTGNTAILRRYLAQNGPSRSIDIKEWSKLKKINIQNFRSLLHLATKVKDSRKKIYRIGHHKSGFWYLKSDENEAKTLHHLKQQPPRQYLEKIQQKWQPNPLYLLKHASVSVLRRIGNARAGEIAYQLHIPTIRYREAKSQEITYTVFDNLMRALEMGVGEGLLVRVMERGRYVYFVSNNNSYEELPERVFTGIINAIDEYLMLNGCDRRALVGKLKIIGYNSDRLRNIRTGKARTAPIEVLQYLVGEISNYRDRENGYSRELCRRFGPYIHNDNELFIPSDVLYIPGCFNGCIGVVTSINNDGVGKAIIRILDASGNPQVTLHMNKNGWNPRYVP